MVAARLLERGVSVAQLLREAVAIGDGLRALTIETGLPFSEVGGRGGQRRIVRLLRLEQCRSAIGNRLLQFRFALGQALDVGSGCLVVAARLLERGGSVVQLLCEAVAIGEGLRAFTIEIGLPFGEVGSRGGQRRIVLLLCIAQCGLAIGDGLLERGTRRGFPPELSIELRLAFRGLLACREPITRCAGDGLVERGSGGRQSTFELGTAVGHIDESGVDFLLACRKALDVSGSRFEILPGHAKGGFQLA